MSIAVLRRGDVIKAEGYGLANVELMATSTRETVYEIGSITKPLTAAALLLLVEDGRVELDAPVERYVPGVPADWKGITLRQLLNHTGGIPRDPFPINRKTERLEYTRQDIFKLGSARPLLFRPGTRFEYSNLGYYLLGAVIEEASGMAYGDFMAARIFRPLGMQATRLNDYSVVTPGRARGHDWEGELRLGAYQSPSSHAPAGGIISTVTDMARWDAALSKGGLLKPTSLEESWSPARLSGGGRSSYGLGWNLDWVRGRRDISHRGSNSGFSSTLHRYVDDGLSVIVLANLAGADLERVARVVVGHFVPELRLLSSLPASSDPHPAWTERVRVDLAQLSQGKSHAAFSPEFIEEFRRLNRALALASRLETLRSFTFLDSRTVGKWRGNRPGGVVQRLEYYRLESGSRNQGYVFSVDAGDRVLWIELEEDPPRLSAMEPGTDNGPAVTRDHEGLMRGWLAGVRTGSSMTGGLKEAFTDEVLRGYQQRLAGATGLTFLQTRDTRGDGLEKLGCVVTGVRYYLVRKPGPPLFMICYLGPNDELADVDLSWQ
jgi:CubicO group peptidase (beta-lactamase class C family)